MQVYSQLGDDTPDVHVGSLKAMYETTQSLIAHNHISAGHDISDGGIAVTLLEAAFAGNCGIRVGPNPCPCYPMTNKKACGQKTAASLLGNITLQCTLIQRNLFLLCSPFRSYRIQSRAPSQKPRK